jgi:Na+-transporting methylmalonyl-CoA/oxaloacetate decarboxylase gamma subunit
MKLHLQKTKFTTGCAVYLIFVIIIIFAAYGAVQLYTRSSRFTLIENQRSKIAHLETKIMFLENNDFALAIQNMSEMEQDELKLRNEQIKQKRKKNNANR